MNRVVLIYIFSLLLGHPLHGQNDGKRRSPNIIYILADDLGYGDLSVYNPRAQRKHEKGPFIHTPNLDKMAKNGLLFTDHYAAAPVCAPSRASILTGKSQGHASVRDNQFDKELAEDYTFATLLKASGYRTAAIGKWGLQGQKDSLKYRFGWPAHPLEKGFDYFYGYMRHVDGHEHYPKEGLYRGRKIVRENNIDVTEELDRCYTTDLWTAAAKRWIVSNGSETPFCLYLAYDAPHAVLELPASAYPKGGGLNGGVQWLGEKGHMINTAVGQVDSYMEPEIQKAVYDSIAEDGQKKTIAWPDTYKRYASSVRRIDQAVGDLTKLLEDMGIAENTMIIFTSDNGPSMESYLPQPFVNYSPEFFHSFGIFDGIKRDVLEGGIRVPTIAYWPAAIAKGSVVQRPSIAYDWLPTFLEMANLPLPAAIDGVSLLPTLTNKGVQRKSNIYIEYQVGGATPRYSSFGANNSGRQRGQMQMVRIDHMVGIRYNIKSTDDAFEVYDISHDYKQRMPFTTTTATQDSLKAYILQHRRADKAASRPYDGLLIPANNISTQQVGLKAICKMRRTKWLEDIIPADSAIILKDLKSELPVRSGQVLVSGYLKIPKSGKYKITVIGKHLVTLKLHDIICMDNDYREIEKQKSIVLNLEKGAHRFALNSEIVNGYLPVSMTIENELGDLSELSGADFL